MSPSDILSAPSFTAAASKLSGNALESVAPVKMRATASTSTDSSYSKINDARHHHHNHSAIMRPSKSTPRRLRKTSFGIGPKPSLSLGVRRNPGSSSNLSSDIQLLPRLEEENANLPPQDSIGFILAQIERQNVLLDEDPKSVCIQSNELRVHLTTMQHLVQDSAAAAAAGEEEIDWEFWSAVTEDFAAVACKLPHLLSAKLKAGIPSKVRGVIWQAMSQSASLHLETVYGQLLAENSPYERIIQRDLARTFPNVDMFKQEGGDGQQALQRVLKAYSLYDSHVGYCQGLAFLVGPLLMNMPEQAAFCVFVRLMETYEMRTMFTLNMEGLQLRLYQFTALLAQILPALSDHLADYGVHSPMYASQWFLTLFAYAFPVSLVLRIYDIVFAEGASETIMRVAIAILKRSEDKILQLTEFEDILDHVTSKLHREFNDDASQMINDAMELSGIITRDKMDQLAELYVRELEQEKKQTDQVLAVRFNFWSRSEKKKKATKTTTANKRVSVSSAEEMASVSPPTPSQQQRQRQSSSPPPPQPLPALPHEDVAVLHEQIEDLLLALSQIQSEHLELKQEHVQVRMDKMDLEAERDNLKMMVEDYEPDLQAELASLKAANFELHQQNEELRHQNKMAKETQTELVEKLVVMKSKMDKLESQSATQDRCRELEQMLADAKLHIAELETFGPSSSLSSSSRTKRRSLDPVSLSNRPTQQQQQQHQSKRSSIYGRLWSSVTTQQAQDTPPTSPI